MSFWSTTDWLAVVAAIVLAAIAMHVGHSGTLFAAAGVSAVFAMLAWVLRGVTGSGAIAGGAIAFVFFRAGGWRMFVLLLAVFVLTTSATKFGSMRKPNRTSAKVGRSASQVTANLLAPTLVLLLQLSGAGVLICAALAELATDTVSSEVGEMPGRNTYRLTDWRKVPSGTNGGISLSGTCFGVLAAILTAMIAFGLGIQGRLWIAGIAGITGMLVDSLLGAAFEDRGWLNNEGVNLLGTASAVGIAWAMLRTNLV